MFDLVERDIATGKARVPKVTSREGGAWKLAVDKATAREVAAAHIRPAKKAGNEDAVEEASAVECRVLEADVSKRAMFVRRLVKRYAVQSLAAVNRIDAGVWRFNVAWGTTNEVCLPCHVALSALGKA